ncbi:probable WRKY transcription factor 70 [Cornus florida]|uniref:probable WRKY transcription factor 70 n=1 Tax=Cornus florida TaxID=4283 RepID=UPI0028A1B08A|nr:probable WRKY transcription factor 70 [Cornus florida]
MEAEKLCTNRERVIRELIKGRDCATQLQISLHKSFGDHGRSLCDELAVKILRSFTDTLSVLSSCDLTEICQIPASTQVESPCCGDRRSEESGESVKRPGTTDQRGRYKRRKASQSWIIVSPTIEDGYAWRKYGQKEILKAKYPRCYFRCTHKRSQGCRAIKQVQITEVDPKKYQITYFGHHTCREIVIKAPEFISESDPVDSYVLNFESEVPIGQQDHPSIPLSVVPSSIKKESMEETHSGNLSDNLSSLDSMVWPDLTPLESFCGQEDVTSNNAYSCASTSSYGLDMDFLSRAGDLDIDFQFDEIKF